MEINVKVIPLIALAINLIFSISGGIKTSSSISLRPGYPASPERAL